MFKHLQGSCVGKVGELVLPRTSCLYATSGRLADFI
jgi:hypothetical protein